MSNLHKMCILLFIVVYYCICVCTCKPMVRLSRNLTITSPNVLCTELLYDLLRMFWSRAEHGLTLRNATIIHA